MASTTKLTPLADVKPFKTGSKDQVKVLHTWKQYQTKSGESLEIILADEMGTKIHATVKKNLLHRFERMMVVGEWKFIENFSLNQTSGQIRTTRHQFKMSFISFTVVSKSSNWSDNLFFFISMNVIGQVESVCELQTISVMNKDTSILEFDLRNANDERLPCTLWGKLGEEVYSACRSAGERSLILVIRFGKINVFKGDRRITSSCQTTKVLINLNDPDVIVFKNSLPENCGRISFLSSKPQQRVSYGDETNFDQFPMVTISELQDYLEVGKCKIMCTIYAVDTDWSWFYLVCTRCGKKVYKIPKKEDQKMTKKNKTLYSCETCDAKVSFVSARYKFHLCVMDNTNKLKCFIFDLNAQDILIRKIQDPDVVPDALQNLIGKTFQFLICVEKENLYGGSNTYKVGKFWKGNDVLSADEVNESEDMGDDSLLLSGNQKTLLSGWSSEVNNSGSSSTNSFTQNSDIVDNHFEKKIKVHTLFPQIFVDRTNTESLTRTHNQFSPTVCDRLKNCKSS
ncbi:hypothetical protein EUTSA_v10029216mg [Eutrema salsugineum]|uniref:Replication protein A 70 kDa DNA-binding subunit B/D first OB fold domain-containing protein n=1 Tax=Eutrema salsugineum TaxID=72664 RepID=V4L8H7_EUTSA|nr:hypothetical protein EUTSA_v10029216mg [Eutrema salsugineum]